MIICNKCHKPNEEGSKFCRYCGNSLTSNSSKVENANSQINFSVSKDALNIRLNKIYRYSK